MKKLAVLFIVLLAVALPVLAEVDVKGELWMFASYDFATDPVAAASSFGKAEVNLNYKVDEFNTVKLELDSEGADWSGLTDIDNDGLNDDGDPIGDLVKRNVAIDDFRLITDVGGVFKLPVKVTATFGYFDTYFTDWSYVSMSGWEFYYDWPNKLANDGPDSDGAWQLDVGVGPATIHWWNDFLFDRMMFGVSAAAGPVSGWVTYQAAFSGFGDGDLGVEVKYSGEFGDLKLAVPAFFRYGLGDEAFTYGGGVGVDYKVFHLAAGLEGDDADALDNVVVDVSVAPMEGLKAAVSAYMDLASTNAFTALAIEVRKSLGALNAILGYVIGGEDNVAVPVYDDNYAVANGLYAGLAISY